MTSIGRWWQRLETRERRMVGAAVVVLVAAIVYLLLWQPAVDGIRKLQADLPALHEQDAALRVMAGEAAGLRSAAGATTAIAVPDRAAAVRRSLERTGLWRATSAPLPVAEAAPTKTLTAGGAVTTVGPSAVATRVPPPEIVADGDRVRVRFDEVDYGVWAGWLAAAETELGARAARVSVTSVAPKGPVGHVRAESTFDWTPPSTSSTRP